MRLHQGSFRLEIRKKLFAEYQNRLPREVLMASSQPEFKKLLDNEIIEIWLDFWVEPGFELDDPHGSPPTQDIACS